MIIYYYLVSVFGISEVTLLILKRSKKTSAKTRQDGKSMLLLWITIFGSLNIGYILARMHIGISFDRRVVEYTGIFVYAAAFIIRWTAIVQLGKMFTVDVSISNTHKLKTNGIFEMVRHPSYLGLLLIITGLALLMNNALSFIIILPAAFYAINYRIAIEEKVLSAEFGEQYLDYKLNTRKIIPLLY